MTDLKQRAAEIATGLAWDNHGYYRRPTTQEIESALLQFARELLTREPSGGMIQAGNDAAASPNGNKHTLRGMWKAMAAELAKELEG